MASEVSEPPPHNDRTNAPGSAAALREGEKRREAGARDRGVRGGGARRAAVAPQRSLRSAAPHRLVQVPDLAEQRGEPGVLRSPCHQHLRVGVVEGAQFRQAPDEAGEVLRVLGVVDFRVLVEDAQERLLQLFDVALVPQERAVCGAERGGRARLAGGDAPEGPGGDGGSARGEGALVVTP